MYAVISEATVLGLEVSLPLVPNSIVFGRLLRFLGFRNKLLIFFQVSEYFKV